MESTNAVRAAVSRKTLVEFGRERLVALCEGAGAEAVAEEIAGLFTHLVGPWGQRQIGEKPGYLSHISDDGAPFELCLAFTDGAPEVQFYVEALGQPAGVLSNMRAGRTLLDTLARERAVPLHRLKLIQDLFFPPAPVGAFTIWTGVSCAPGRAPQLKVYLNPQAQGRANALRIVDEAMARLGFELPWAYAREALSEASGRSHELAILSLDLTDAPDARVKVYVRHHRASVRELEAFGRLCADYRPGDAPLFYGALGGGNGPFQLKPPITELVFSKPHARVPDSVTWEFPIHAYAPSDLVAAERIAACMRTLGVAPERYLSALRALALRPLGERAGLHAHVTLRRVQNQPRMAVYFASEAYVVD